MEGYIPHIRGHVLETGPLDRALLHIEVNSLDKLMVVMEAHT